MASLFEKHEISKLYGLTLSFVADFRIISLLYYLWRRCF